MRLLFLLAAGVATVGVPAMAEQPGRAEIGYSEGALGLAAIDRGDWAAAERQLTDPRFGPADDPAKLINLGRVYVETGRLPLAIAAWQAALRSRRQHMVELGDGSVASTEDVARAALARHRYQLASSHD